MAIPEEAIAAAKAAHAKWGVWASVSLAQYCVESAWGRLEPQGSNNGFGIQALPGRLFVSAPSHEFVNGRLVPVTERFAVFESVADAFDAHAELIARNPAYARAMAAKTADEFAYALTGVYATAPDYGGALVRVMKTYDLYLYDEDPGALIATSLTPRLRMPETVGELQSALNTLHAVPLLVVDGRFGAATSAAVAAFQKRVGLESDGIPGPLTLAAIAKAIAAL